MERFELVQTEKERERKRREYRGAGFNDREIELLLNDKKDFDREFGLNHTFKKLSLSEEEKVDLLFKKREISLEKYNEILLELEKIYEKESKLWNEIQEINHEICEIEGHRLEADSFEIIDEDGYGGYMSFGFVRHCLVCGEKVNERDIKDEDVVVKGVAEPIKRGKTKIKKNCHKLL